VQLRIDRTEGVRAQAQELAVAGGPPDELIAVAAGDEVAVSAAWASFVPFLAHPVMAGTARAGMDVLDQTGPAARLVA
jgi:hypothetical protein